MEQLISAALADGVLTEKEKQILFKKAESLGIDLDEFEMVLDARLYKIKSSKPIENTNALGGRLQCPRCKQDINPGESVCPSCGFAFDGIKATASSERLYELLNKYSKENPYPMAKSRNTIMGEFVSSMEQTRLSRGITRIVQGKMTLIADFPVPNNRADLLDFLSSIQPKANPFAPKNGVKFSAQAGHHESLGYAYWLLYTNCINKAKISFSSDPAFKPFFVSYDEKSKKKGLFARIKRMLSK